MGDLAEHLGVVHLWALRMLAMPADHGRVPWEDPDDPQPGDDLAGWYEARLADLVGRLGALDPAEIVNTFLGPLPAAFWPRRQAHEVRVHRWDAEAAHGPAEAIEAEVASDGIDEYLSTFLPRHAKRVGPLEASIHLHLTDSDGEWLLGLHGEQVEVTREHGVADGVLRGSGSDVLLGLYGRVGTESLDLAGDSTLTTRFLDLLNGRRTD